MVLMYALYLFKHKFSKMNTLQLNITHQANNEYDENMLQYLLEKAKKKGCDSLFIKILENKPLYPINHTDHEIDEFGQRISFCGDTRKTGIEQSRIGYVLGAAHPKEGMIENGWLEVVFPYVTPSAAPVEYVYGLSREDISF